MREGVLADDSVSRRHAAEALEALRAVVHSRDRLLNAARAGALSSELVAAIESDIALAVRTLRLANRGPRRGTVASVVSAVASLGHVRLAALAESTPVYDLFETDALAVPESLRLHSLAVHRTAARLAAAAGEDDCHDELVTAALLHDIGKVVLMRANGRAPKVNGDLPEARVELERDALGTDHAAAGGALARDWGFPESLAEAIEAHHSDDGSRLAAFVRLADLLTLYGQGEVVDLECVIRLSEGLGVGREALSVLMYELPFPVARPRAAVDPCPLSERELDVLRHLAEGKVYKQIGAELALSASTVRSHLHRIYTRIGAADRTQAVIYARDRGWI